MKTISAILSFAAQMARYRRNNKHTGTFGFTALFRCVFERADYKE